MPIRSLDEADALQQALLEALRTLQPQSAVLRYYDRKPTPATRMQR